MFCGLYGIIAHIHPPPQGMNLHVDFTISYLTINIQRLSHNKQILKI